MVLPEALQVVVRTAARCSWAFPLEVHHSTSMRGPSLAISCHRHARKVTSVSFIQVPRLRALSTRTAVLRALLSHEVLVSLYVRGWVRVGIARSRAAVWARIVFLWKDERVDDGDGRVLVILQRERFAIDRMRQR
jgi:hypothetical protein